MIVKKMNGKRLSHKVPKASIRHNAKLKDIQLSSTPKPKSEGKVVEPDLLNIPVIKENENNRLLPKYTSILAKSGEDIVSMDDLDLLQQDLEKLLSTSVVRIRYLLSEIGEIDKNDESLDIKAHIKTSLKRKRVEEKPKFNDFKVTLPKNNSDKFWASIEPFCANVTNDDVTFLDSLIQELSKEIDLKIPEIGDHYANRWSEETVSHEYNLGKSSAKKPAMMNDIKKLGLNGLIKAFSVPNTQKFLADIFEEKLWNSPHINGENGTKRIKLKPTLFSTVKPSAGAQKLGICLDVKLKKELLDQGIISMEEFTKSMPEDEVISEIKRCQQELTAVNSHNKEELMKLKTVVVNDLHSNNVREQLEDVDKQVLDLYNKIVVTRKMAQQEEGDEFDKEIFSEQMTKEYEIQADSLLKQQMELNKEINGLAEMSY